MNELDAVDLADGAEWFAYAFLYPHAANAMEHRCVPAIVSRVLQNAEVLWCNRQGVVYCSLFDVGKPEPAAPLQEGFYHHDPHTRLRRVVNFYRHYDVVQQSQWAPDHLAVELFFVSYLLRLCRNFPHRDDLKLAVRCFVKAHPGSFVGNCLQRVREADSSGTYVALLEGLYAFLALLGAERRIELTDVNADQGGIFHA